MTTQDSRAGQRLADTPELTSFTRLVEDLTEARSTIARLQEEKGHQALVLDQAREVISGLQAKLAASQTALLSERDRRFAVEQRLAATQQEESKLRFFEAAVRFVADVPKDASPFAASTQVVRMLHTWSAFRARVAGMLGCAPDADPDAMLSALGQRFKPRDEVSEVLALKGEITTLKGQLSAVEARGRVLQNTLAGFATRLGLPQDADSTRITNELDTQLHEAYRFQSALAQAVGLQDAAQIVQQVTQLVTLRDAEKARHTAELTEAQKQCAAWEVQAQDHRDRATAFLNLVSRALGAEPSSLSAYEALQRIKEGAAAMEACKRLAADDAIGTIDPRLVVECVVKSHDAARDLHKRLVTLLFPSAAPNSIGAAALVARIEDALTTEALLQQYAPPDLAACAAKEGMLPVVLLIKQLRTGEVYEERKLHDRLVEALHIDRPASAVTSDQLVAWAKQTYEQRALVDRLAAALRQHVPLIGSLQSPVAVLCDLAEDGSLAEALHRDSAWHDLVDAYNANAGRSSAPHISSTVERSKETLLRHVKLGARLNAWLREQQG